MLIYLVCIRKRLLNLSFANRHFVGLITADIQLFTNFVWTIYLAEQYFGLLFRLNLHNHDTSTSCAN